MEHLVPSEQKHARQPVRQGSSRSHVGTQKLHRAESSKVQSPRPPAASAFWHTLPMLRFWLNSCYVEAIAPESGQSVASAVGFAF